MENIPTDQYEDVRSGSETVFLSNEHTDQNMDNSVKGVVGTLGIAILILVLIAVLSYVTGHRRIQVHTSIHLYYLNTDIFFQILFTEIIVGIPLPILVIPVQHDSPEQNSNIDSYKNNKRSKTQVNKIQKTQCIRKSRRKTVINKKTGIPIHLFPVGRSIIRDQLVPGQVSRIQNSIRYFKPSQTGENYDLGNEKEMEFDEADCPRKAVPRWAMGDMLKHALTEQEEIDTDCIFSVCDPPNLDIMFPQSAAKRDIWRTPVSSYSSRWG